MKKKICFYGILIGFINALFGAGGGMIAVPLLKSCGLEQKKAQATTICVILPLTLITCIIYLTKGYVELSDAVVFAIPGFVGAVAGTSVFKKLSNKFLKKIFAAFMLWAGLRLIFK